MNQFEAKQKHHQELPQGELQVWRLRKEGEKAKKDSIIADDPSQLKKSSRAAKIGS